MMYYPDGLFYYLIQLYEIGVQNGARYKWGFEALYHRYCAWYVGAPIIK